MEQTDFGKRALRAIGMVLILFIISFIVFFLYFYLTGTKTYKFEMYAGWSFGIVCVLSLFIFSLDDYNKWKRKGKGNSFTEYRIYNRKRRNKDEEKEWNLKFSKVCFFPFAIFIGAVLGNWLGTEMFQNESIANEQKENNSYEDLGIITIYSDWGDGKGLRTRPGNLWVKSYNGEKFYYVGTSESKNLLSKGSWNVYGNSFNAMFHSESGNIKHYLNVSAWPSANIVHSGSSSSGGGSYPVQPGYPASDGSYPIGSTNYDTHSGFSSSQGQTQQRERVWRDCSHCHGKGTVVHDSYIATFGNDSKAYCAQCGQSYWRSTGHSHVTCPICHGNRGRWSE